MGLYKQYKVLTDEEIQAKQPKFWRKLINDFNNLLSSYQLSEQRYSDAKQDWKTERTELKEKLEIATNLLKTYDKPVQELIVESHIVKNIKGYWQPQVEYEDEWEGEVDFVSAETESQRIVVRDWGVNREITEHNNGWGEPILCCRGTWQHPTDYYYYESQGASFWWIDVNGEEHWMADGAIIFVKSRDGKVLFELNKQDKKNLVIADDQRWTKE